MDFDTVLTGLAATTVVAAIIGSGAVKAAPGFARWGVNKIVGMFR